VKDGNVPWRREAVKQRHLVRCLTTFQGIPSPGTSFPTQCQVLPANPWNLLGKKRYISGWKTGKSSEELKSTDPCVETGEEDTSVPSEGGSCLLRTAGQGWITTGLTRLPDPTRHGTPAQSQADVPSQERSVPPLPTETPSSTQQRSPGRARTCRAERAPAARLAHGQGSPLFACHVGAIWSFPWSPPWP